MANQPPLDPYLNLHSKANDRTSRATFKRGIINAINAQLGTMDVQIVGSHSTILKGIPFSSAVNSSAVRVGDKCRIDMFDETNPYDCVVAYIYGRKLTTSAYGIYNISTAISSGGTAISIPHTLGVMPTFAFASCRFVSSISAFSPAVFTEGTQVTKFDANFIYVTVYVGISTGVQPLTFFWFATCA
jgi:hypothetical protein